MSTILHHWPAILKLRESGMVLPEFVDLHLTSVCNQECAGCAFKDHHDNQIMPADRFNQACNILMDNGVKAFAFCGGGEPCCAPYLTDAMAQIKARGGFFSMLTNGSLLNSGPHAGRLIEMFAAHGSWIRISLEASNVEDYMRYKGVSELEWWRVLENICLLVEKTAGRPRATKCTVGIKFGVGKSLLGQRHYEAGLKLAGELGVDRVTFRAFSHEPEELSREEQIVEAMNFETALNRMGPPCQVTTGIVKPTKVPQCWLNPLHTVMDWEGNLYICCYYYFRKAPAEHRIGNIFDQNFKEMWFSAEHRRKIEGIRREECAKVGCKFFAYHAEVESELANGNVYFL